MRALILLAVIGCGAPEALEVEAEASPRIIIPGKVTPWMHVEGATVDGHVIPTGAAFDARPEGWRIACLNGATPRLEAGRLYCAPTPSL